MADRNENLVAERVNRTAMTWLHQYDETFEPPDAGIGYALCGAYKGEIGGVANCPECLATERDLREAEARQGHQAGWES